MIGSGWAGLAGSLAITLGLLALALRLLKRLHGAGTGAGAGVPLAILQRLPLGPRQGIALVRVGERVLVVSLADGGSRCLAELEGEDLAAALRGPAPAPVAPIALPGRLPARPRWLPSALGGLGLGLALALCAVPAAAQQRAAAPSAAPAIPVPAREARPAAAAAAPQVKAPAAPTVELRVGQGADELRLSGAVGIVVMMGALTLLPALFLLMTSFTRIVIVLHFLRSALGTQQAPPGQLLVAIAVLLTGVVMNPVLEEANRTALQPYFAGEIGQVEAYQRSLRPFREFMLANTREQDVATFTELSGVTQAASIDEVPTATVVSAFMTSELRTAFQMGFVIFLPFVVVDLVVASVLMSLGMFMLPPAMVSLPFKLLLFVLADGWPLVMQNLVASFQR